MALKIESTSFSTLRSSRGQDFRSVDLRCPTLDDILSLKNSESYLFMMGQGRSPIYSPHAVSSLGEAGTLRENASVPNGLE